MPKTILIVHNFYQFPGGEDIVVQNEQQLLKENGFRALLYTRSNKEILSMNPLQKGIMGISSIFSLKTFFEIRKIIKNEHVNYIHVHNTLSLISPSVYYAAISMKKPVLQTLHNFRFLCVNALLFRDKHICEDCLASGSKCAIKHRCYHNSVFQTFLCVINQKIHRFTGIYKKIFFICPTEFNKQLFLDTMQNYFSPEKVFVKSNFIKDDYQNLKSDNLPVHGDYYLYIGRLDESKGILDLISTWMSIHDKKLIICGSGPEKAYIEEFIKSKKISNILLIGQRSHTDVLDYIYNANAVIMPTKLYEGAFPLVAIECLMCGTPIICENIGNTGSVIRQISPQTTYRSISELDAILNNLAHENLSSLYRSYYLEHFTSSINIVQYKKILDAAGYYQ